MARSVIRGNNSTESGVEKVMRILLLALLTMSSAAPIPSQERQDAGSDGGSRRFLGTWKSVCADGKDFLILTFTQAEGGSLEGTIRLANMRGDADGNCATVVDPPSDKHALTVTDARLIGTTLMFRGSKRMEFEMTVPTADEARLKFIGTASEDNPWRLRRAR